MLKTSFLTKHKEQILFYTMAIIGGFYGGFAISNFDVLGSAETTNMIRLVISFLGKDYYQSLLCFIAAIIYLAATALSKLANDYIPKYIHIISIFVDFLVTLWLCFAPRSINYILVLYPMFFACAFQWNAFPGAKGYVSSSIFSTNNYRQMIFGFTEYFEDREKNKKSLEKGRFFLGTLFWFHFGVAIAFLSENAFGNYGALTNLIFVAIATILASNGDGSN